MTGESVLKLIMYRFYYEVLKAKYGDKRGKHGQMQMSSLSNLHQLTKSSTTQ